MEGKNSFSQVLARTMQDIRVECDDEFQQNFRREAFFNGKWKRRTHNDGSGRKLLHGPGKEGVHLAQALFPGKVNGLKLTYSTTLPYADIHNEGGVIRVTAKMKRYFWARYMEATGAVTYRKDGKRRESKRNRKLDADAEFFKIMALKKVGSHIVIPKRQFIGMHPLLDKAITAIMEENLNEYFGNDPLKFIRIKK